MRLLRNSAFLFAWVGWWAMFFLLLSASGAHAAPPFSGRVVGVHDGDTLTVLTAENASIRIRLAEIDAPELHQPFGQQSKQSLSDLCFGQQAGVAPVTTDRYGRTVARVSCQGKDASLHQVEAGLAWAYTKYQTDPAIPAAETVAHAARRGLWADPDPVPPWQFRRKRPT
jgi:endonuclease YncB( thermonuclease family)